MIIIGKFDNEIKDWLSNKERFADLFNGVVYNGKQVILPDELTVEKNESSIILPENNGRKKSVSRYRDIIMNWKNGCNLAVLAIEAQDKIHYAMPVRNMLYDSLSYVEQMKAVWNNMPEEKRPRKFTDEFFSRFRKEDNIYPVITLVLYWGDSGDWNAALSIYDMFGENISDKEKRQMSKYVSDYKINLVEIQKMENLDLFKTDLRETIGMIQCRYDEEKMSKYITNNKEVLSNLDIEASRVIKEVLNIRDLNNYITKKEGKKVADLCKAWEDHRMSGMQEGIKEGIRILIVTSKEYGVDEATIKVKLAEKYELSCEEIDDYMNMYA